MEDKSPKPVAGCRPIGKLYGKIPVMRIDAIAARKALIARNRDNQTRRQLNLAAESSHDELVTSVLSLLVDILHLTEAREGEWWIDLPQLVEIAEGLYTEESPEHPAIPAR